MKRIFKKMSAIVCIITVLLSVIGIPNIAEVNGLREVKAEDATYTKMGFTDLGIMEKQVIKTNTSFQAVGRTSTDALTAVEFEGIVNIATGGQVELFFGGTSRMDGATLVVAENGTGFVGWTTAGAGGVKQYLNHQGYGAQPGQLQNRDLILNIKLNPTQSSDTESNVAVTFTLTDVNTGMKIYNFSFTQSGLITANLAPNLFVITRASSSITVEPMESEWTVLTMKDFGIMGKYTSEQTGTLSGSMDMVKIEATLNIPSGTAGTVGPKVANIFCFQKDNTTDNFKLRTMNGSQSGFANVGQINYNNYYDKDTNWELYFWYADGTDGNATTAHLKMMIYLNGTRIGVYQCRYEENLSYITRTISIPANTGVDLDWTELTMKDFGILPIKSSSVQAGTLSGSMDMVKIEATLNIPSGTTGTVGPEVAKIFGFQKDSATDNFKLRTLSGSQSGFANVTQINYNNYYDKDTNWELYFWYADGTDGNATTAYLKMMIYLNGTRVGVYQCRNEENLSYIARTIRIPANTGVVYEGANLTVGGGTTNTTAYTVLVEQGDTLPTGYTEDGKYILGWTVNGEEVTEYDHAQTDYVAEFIDTKMLEVKQQNNGQTPKDVRFIASLNKVEGYEAAGFVFANTAVDGELTVANGANVPLNVAYKALNAAGEAVTANEVYDEYSTYFIAYAIKQIPANATIYARAYVIIDGVTIYGDMTTFAIDSL